MTSSVNDLTTLSSTKMANSSSSLSTFLTTLPSNIWTDMPSSMSRTPTPTSASLTNISTDSPSFPSSTSPPSTWTSSLTSMLATQTTALISSAIPYSTSDGVMPRESNTSSGVPEEERRHYLAMLQEETTRKMIPTIVFLATVAVVGVVGNSMVLLVYSNKVRRNATDIFIMAIATFDLVANVLSTPVEMYTLFHLWDFHTPLLCKFRVYAIAFTCWTPSMALLAVAFSRYQKICRPNGKQTTVRTARIANALIVLACSLFAVPQFIFYGIRRRQTPKPDVFGEECNISEEYVGTIWPMVYYGGVMLLFLIVCIPLIVFYTLIGIQAWRHSRIHGVSVTYKRQTTFDQTMLNTLDSVDDIDPRKSHFCCFYRNKNKNDKPPKDSGDDEDNESEEKTNIESKLTSCQRSKDAMRSMDEAERYCTKMMRSPTKNVSHMNMPIVRELSVKLNKIKDNEMNVNADKDMNEEENNDELKTEASSEISVPLECSNDLQMQQMSKNDAENHQNENSVTKEMGDFASSMQWVDITYCLKEREKADDNDDVTDQGSSGKGKSSNVKVSRQSRALQKMADTLTRAKKAKKESIAHEEIEEGPPNTTAISTAPGGLGKHHSMTPIHDTIVESNVGYKRRREVKSCETSSRNSPWNGTLTKWRKSKSSLHRRVFTRTTLMLILISAVYVIALVPNLVLISFKFMVQNFLENKSDAAYASYHLFLRFFFVNSAANAIIYSLCDVRFRDQVQKIIKCRK